FRGSRTLVHGRCVPVGRGREIAATFLIALGLFSLLSLHTTATGEAGRHLSVLMRTLSVHAATVIALVVIWLVAVLFRRPWDWGVGRRLTCVVLLSSVAATALHLYRLAPAGHGASVMALGVVGVGAVLFRRPGAGGVGRRLTGVVHLWSVAATVLHLSRLAPAWPGAWVVAEEAASPWRMQAGGVVGGALAAV